MGFESVNNGLALAARVLSLTPREIEVLRGVAAGEHAAETGHRLFLAAETVRTHRNKIRLKLGARTLAHAVDIAHRGGAL